MRQVIIGLVAVGAMGAASLGQQVNDPNLITLRHDFESEPQNAPAPGPFTLGNATFDENSSGSGGPGWRLISVFPNQGRQLTDNAGITEIIVSFDQPMVRAGLLVGIGNATFDARFFDGNNNLLGTVSQAVQGTGGNFFAGWESNAGIRSIVITEPTGDNGLVGGIDDVRYDIIPAPGAAALLGLSGLAAARRRR